MGSSAGLVSRKCVEKGEELCHLYGLVTESGIVELDVPGIRLFRINQYHKMTPQMYQQGVVVILQGNKVGHLNDYRFDYDSNHCLIVATPYPIACETFASPEAPLIGLDIDFDLTIIQELVDTLEHHQHSEIPKSQDNGRGVAVTQITPDIRGCICRLLGCLKDPLDARVLGKQLLREFYFHLLKSDQGHLLAQYCKQDSALSRVTKVISHVQSHYDEKLAINDLADMAGMSVSAFHRAFKQVVTDPPLQYIKKIRLNKAKTMMSQDGMPANVAALKVGYESPTQFSREFKRYFGVPPSRVSHIGSF
ncbi:AraC family transcriptional regulator [Photobacterium sp. DNB23_23_1]|uniref:AraC family transcriptional regulator n=1 Tax=Photobacterium pectinilyticum TaxID=2906793 RepID=A0ABT1N2R9_9GAMM|nr:AraC family transcriptional regulator [Photobacterium sp. ZSDE20]MCQ1058046.1 AraC family transcriptional regulator [Photobacterium sp. ZSDE20]MDD1822579.1 AraC family transcriptional regulator [Photobacterium sp. ZSDE20]